MIPPSRNDSPNSPLLYTGNDAKDVRRRGHSTPETGVERFSVCWAGVDRRSSFEAYRCNRDTCGWVTIPRQRKKKRKKEKRLVGVRESFHSRITYRGVYLNRTLNITLSEGKIEWVCDSVSFHACWSREAYVALLEVRPTWTQSGEELSWGMLWGTGGVVSFKVSVFFFYLLSLSLSTLFCADSSQLIMPRRGW